MKPLLFVVGGLSLFAAFRILDWAGDRGYSNGYVAALCSSYALEGIRSKQLFQNQIEGVLLESDGMDRDELTQYLANKVRKFEGDTWSKCLTAVREID